MLDTFLTLWDCLVQTFREFNKGHSLIYILSRDFVLLIPPGMALVCISLGQWVKDTFLARANIFHKDDPFLPVSAFGLQVMSMVVFVWMIVALGIFCMLVTGMANHNLASYAPTSLRFMYETMEQTGRWLMIPISAEARFMTYSDFGVVKTMTSIWLRYLSMLHPLQMGSPEAWLTIWSTHFALLATVVTMWVEALRLALRGLLKLGLRLRTRLI